MVHSLSERKHSDMESEPDDIQDLADPVNDISETSDAQIVSKNEGNTEPTNNFVIDDEILQMLGEDPNAAPTNAV